MSCRYLASRYDCMFAGTVMNRRRWRKGAKHAVRFFILSLVLLPSLCPAQDISWERLSDGLMVSVWKPGDACPTVPTMLVVDMDPERTKFSVHYYAQEALSEPPRIDDWQKRTGHHVLFNAGLFRENFAYLGLLYKDGRSLGSRRHASWQGLFVAEPFALGLKKARILDLAAERFDEEQPRYREAAQALMLLDLTGKIRVREGGKHAYQTIVAETEAGHILLLKSLGAVRLYDIAQCFKDALPAVRQAMAMDGGSSSDVRILGSLWEKDFLVPEHASWKSLFGGSTGSHIPLPTVIGASPR
ncbi:MAG: hypothetical protein CAF42_001085 [Nitrospira sp. CG24B]|nr:MAG: hypothetical protein CAF42_001085 [Nitrospira sp. CG24B]